jgi:ubiquinone/menaquinone biosynthesis C-methylase UbiE
VLGDAASVVNVGAGAGSYEPGDREVIAVEPSPLMIAKRPQGAAPTLQGVAEALPLDDQSVDAAMGTLTIHHWDDLDAGLTEMRRVARKRIVPAPSRCQDEFTSAPWDRPERFLEPETLRASSLWHQLSPEMIARGQEHLRADLASGRWDEKHGHLRTLPELDIGLRLISEEL